MWNRPEDEDLVSGDDGMTTLANSERVPKTHSRIIVAGELEELMCHLGLLAYETTCPELITFLGSIQHDLACMREEFLYPGKKVLEQKDLEYLEAMLSGSKTTSGPLTGTKLIGRDAAKDQLKFRLAGTVCRRVERNACRVMNFCGDPVNFNDTSLAYLNRLADFLFVLSTI